MLKKILSVLFLVAALMSCDMSVFLFTDSLELSAVSTSEIKGTITTDRSNVMEVVVERASTSDGVYQEIYRGSLPSFNDSSLSAGTTYFYKVSLILDDSKNVPVEPVKSCKTYSQITAPLDLSATLATAGVGYEATLNWTAVERATSYEIYYSESYVAEAAFFDNPGNFTIVGLSSAIVENTVTFNLDFVGGAAPSQRYYFFIKAKNADHTTELSQNVVYVDVPGPAKPPVSVVVSLNNNNAVQLSWQSGVNADSYMIFRSDSADGIYEEIGTTTNLAYVDTTVQNAHTYYYKIASMSTTQGPTDKNDIIQNVLDTVTAYNVTTGLPQVSGLVINFDDTNEHVSITWTAVNGASAYRIYRSIYQDREFELIETVTTNWIDDNNNLKHDMTYYYYVTAIDGASNIESPNSEILSAYVVLFLAAPTDLLGSPLNDTQISLSWVAPVSRHSTLYYDVEVYENGVWGRSNISDSLSTTGVIVNLQPGVQYQFRVIAKTADGLTSQYSATTLVKTFPQLPVITFSDVTSDSMVLNWNTSSGAAGYNIYMATDINGIYSKKNASLVSSNSYSVDNLVNGVEYFFKITALSTDSQEPGLNYVTAVSQKTLALETPIGVSLQKSGDLLIVSWSNVSGAASYEVEWTVNTLNNTWTSVSPEATITGGYIQFIPSPINIGENVYIRVRAINSNGESAWSTVKQLQWL